MQRVKDLETISHKWDVSTKSLPLRVRKAVEEETAECMDQRGCKTPGEQDPTNQQSNVMNSQRLELKATGQYRSAPGPLHIHYSF